MNWNHFSFHTRILCAEQSHARVCASTQTFTHRAAARSFSVQRVLYGCSRTIQLLMRDVGDVVAVGFYLLFAFRMGSMCRWQRMRWQLNKWMESNWIRYTYPYSYKARTAHLRLRSPSIMGDIVRATGLLTLVFRCTESAYLHRTQYVFELFSHSLTFPHLAAAAAFMHANQKSEIWCSCARNENGKRWLSTRI